jgi:hypothetical protein
LIKHYSTAEGLNSIGANTITLKGKEIWIGTKDGINILKNSVLTDFIGNSRLGNKKISSLYADSKGDVWIGSAGGYGRIFGDNLFFMSQEEKNDPDVSDSSSSEDEEELSVSSTGTEEEERTPPPKKRKATQAKTPKPKRSPIEDKKYLREILEKYQRDLEHNRKQLDKKLKKYEDLRKDIRKKSEKLDLMTVMTEDFLNQLNEEEGEGITEHNLT